MHDCLDPYDLASVECEEHEVTVIAFDPAYAPLAVLDDAGQHDVAYGAKMLGLEGESLPLLKQATHVAADSLWPVEYAELRKVGPNDEHDVLVEIVSTCPKVSGSPPVVDVPHCLHVLLRHRPRSISRSVGVLLPCK